MLDVPPRASQRPGRPGSPSPSFEEFSLAHRVPLYRALLVVTRDASVAEDVAQDAFVRLWERWNHVLTLEDPAAYLYRTALNGWFHVLRRLRRAARRAVTHRAPSDPIDAIDDRDVLARRLLQLPARQRAALVLTDYLSYDSAEAGRMLGIQAGTVRRLASIARATLRRDREGANP
jgi:RNA polymerase sigma-70 factor (ECF subfamily)